MRLGRGIWSTATIIGTALGGGTLDQTFQVAKAYWESVITDNFTLTIDYGWGNTGSNSTLAFGQSQTYAGTPPRITQAGIVVRSQSNPQWFADPTPADN